LDINDIFNRTIHKSGQYLLSTSNIEINIDAFRILVEDALSIYNKASPYDKTITVNASNRQVSFEDTDEYFSDIGRVPDWISKGTPILNYSTGANPNFLSPAFSRNSFSYSEPIEALLKYHKPLLSVNISGDWEIVAVWNHKVEKVDNEYTVRTITVEDMVFFDILKAMFLQGIGMSRRAFTMDNLPIAMDADALVSDAESQLSIAKEELQNVQKFYLWI